jgi:calcium-dependent protein kinase
MGNAPSDGCAPTFSGETLMVNLEKVQKLCNPAVAASRYHLAKERDLSADYEVSRQVLGQGLCGDVLVARSRLDGRRYAVKTMSKRGAKRSKLAQIVTEVEIHLTLDHPNIARVYDVYESTASISIVTECCEGGELYASLQDKTVYADREAAEVMRQMLRVLKHLHARSVVHRDIKLENFLYHGKDPHEQMARFLDEDKENNGQNVQAEAPQLKLIDFGFARLWDPSTLMMTSCGSAEYVSPDVLCGDGYTDKCDMWSIGIVAWMLLVGYPPFHGERRQMMERIKEGKADWSHQGRWRKVSTDAKDFVRKLVVKDPAQRMDAQSALRHRWLARRTPTVEFPELSGQRALLSMQQYAIGSKMRRAALQLLAQQLDDTETLELRRLFFSIDTESKGWLTAKDICCAGEKLNGLSGNSPDYDQREWISALYATGQHRVYYSDFLAAAASMDTSRHDDAFKATFARFDADRSGSIGITDLCNTLGEKFENTPVVEVAHEAGSADNDMSFDAFVQVVDRCHSTSKTKPACSQAECEYKWMSDQTSTGHRGFSAALAVTI